MTTFFFIRNPASLSMLMTGGSGSKVTGGRYMISSRNWKKNSGWLNMGYVVSKVCDECGKRVAGVECVLKGDFVVLLGEEKWQRFQGNRLLCPDCERRNR